MYVVDVGVESAAVLLPDLLDRLPSRGDSGGRHRSGIPATDGV